MIEYDTFKELEPGKYPATISEVVTEEGKYGPQLKITFSIVGPDMESVSVFQWVKPQISDQYPMFKDLLKLALGKKFEDEGSFDEKCLEGLECEVTVQLVPNADNTKKFLRVSNVAGKKTTSSK